MRSFIIIFALIFLIFTSCIHEIQSTVDSTSNEITTVRYVLVPFRTFQISGTNTKGLKINELKDALVKHYQIHPDANYELFAEVKNTPKAYEDIINAFNAAGVNLLHFWAPVSDFYPDLKQSKYDGHVDILN